MNLEQIKKALQELVRLYSDMEEEYNIALDTEIENVNTVLDDLNQAVVKTMMGR